MLSILSLNALKAEDSPASFSKLRGSSNVLINRKGIYPLRSIENSDSFIPLYEGSDALSFRIKSIRAATHSIYIQTFIFKNDEVGKLIARELVKKKNQGVDVKIVIDNIGSSNGNGAELLKSLKKQGIEVLGLENLVGSAVSKIFNDDPGWVNSLNHAKLWLVDVETANALAIIGGRNIANEYFDVSERSKDDSKNLWTDLDLVVRGKAVGDMYDLFKRDVNYFRYTAKYGGSVDQGVDIWNDNSDIKNKIKPLKHIEEIPFKPSTKLEMIADAFAEKDLTLKEFKNSSGKYRFIQSRPRLKEFMIYESYLRFIQKAKKEIVLSTAYFIPGDPLMKALRDAVKRGVKVHLITNSFTSTDISLIPTVGHYFYNQLVSVNYDPMAIKNEGEFRVYEWLGSRANEGCLHSKWACADNEECIIGSFNLNQRSTRFDTETVIAIQNKNLAKDLSKYVFQNMLSVNEEKASYYRVQEVDPTRSEAYYRPPVLEEIKVQLEMLLKTHL